jgi:hypothetical protein
MINEMLLFGLNELEDGVDGFLLGIIDKAAGINDGRIDVLMVDRVENNFEIIGFQLLHQQFSINQVFCTTQ